MQPAACSAGCVDSGEQRLLAGARPFKKRPWGNACMRACLPGSSWTHPPTCTSTRTGAYQPAPRLRGTARCSTLCSTDRGAGEVQI